MKSEILPHKELIHAQELRISQEIQEMCEFPPQILFLTMCTLVLMNTAQVFNVYDINMWYFTVFFSANVPVCLSDKH